MATIPSTSPSSSVCVCVCLQGDFFSCSRSRGLKKCRFEKNEINSHYKIFSINKEEGLFKQAQNRILRIIIDSKQILLLRYVENKKFDPKVKYENNVGYNLHE